jgi:hypothetical protein
MDLIPASSHLFVKRTGHGADDVKGLYVGKISNADPGIDVKAAYLPHGATILYRQGAASEAIRRDGEWYDVVQLTNVVAFYSEPAPPSAGQAAMDENKKDDLASR